MAAATFPGTTTGAGVTVAGVAARCVIVAGAVTRGLTGVDIAAEGVDSFSLSIPVTVAVLSDVLVLTETLSLSLVLTLVLKLSLPLVDWLVLSLANWLSLLLTLSLTD